jgi:hypothetical protein
LAIFEDRQAWWEDYTTRFLAHFQATGETDWKQYSRPKNHHPLATQGIDLSQSRLVLISSAGGYLKDRQTPFDAPHPLGDYTLRLFPTDTPFAALDYAHTHYDHTAVNADPQVLLPLHHLADWVQAGKIGSLASQVISFSGYHPDATRVVDALIPQIVQAAQADQAQAALLVPS